MKSLRTALAALFALIAFSASALAAGLEVKQLGDNVYAIVGEMVQRSPENLGNNATFGLVVTDAGAVLIDPGGTHQGAEQLAATIKRNFEELGG